MAPVLELPDPALVVLVGPAGAGKSTLAARHFAPDEVLASDAIRAELTGDPADQRATRRAFELLHRRLDARLAALHGSHARLTLQPAEDDAGGTLARIELPLAPTMTTAPTAHPHHP